MRLENLSLEEQEGKEEEEEFSPAPSRQEKLFTLLVGGGRGAYGVYLILRAALGSFFFLFVGLKNRASPDLFRPLSFLPTQQRQPDIVFLAPEIFYPERLRVRVREL